MVSSSILIANSYHSLTLNLNLNFFQSSGVAVNHDCITAYQDLKLKKQFKYIIYGLNDTKTEVVVYKKSDVSDYEAFLNDLPEFECRWAVYDFEFDKGEGKRNKLLFYSWYPNYPSNMCFTYLNLYRSPDVARIKEKMVYASSKDALRKTLDGISSEIQGTDSSEVSLEIGPFSLSTHISLAEFMSSDEQSEVVVLNIVSPSSNF